MFNWNEFIKETISDKQYTDESILNYIKDPDGVRYPNEKIIPIYPINPYDWINKVSLNSEKEKSI